MKRCAILIALLVPTVAQAAITEAIKVQLEAGRDQLVSNLTWMTIIGVPILLAGLMIYIIWRTNKRVMDSNLNMRNWFK